MTERPTKNGGDARQLGPYRIIRVLGAGASGDVYLAHRDGPSGFRKEVALKVLRAHLSEDAGFVERFTGEAKLVALLSHPNVAQVFELAQDERTYFMAMEYVDGLSLGRLRRLLQSHARQIPLQVAVDIICQLLAGLRAAHLATSEDRQPRPIVHLDVNPENVLLTRSGVVKLVDFGISKALDASFALTRHAKGTWGYAPPEQIRGEPLDPRADLYATGAVLHELLAGAPPFTGRSPAEILERILEGNAPSLRSTRPEAPEALEGLLQQALAGQREERFQSADAMLHALAPFRTTEPVTESWLKTTLADVALEQGNGASATAPVKRGTQPLARPEAKTEQVVVRRSVRWQVATAVAVAGCLGAGAWWWARAGEEEPRLEVVEPAPAPPPPPTALVPPPASPSQPHSPKAAHPKMRPERNRRVLSGEVKVLIAPWAEVFVDGKRVGMTPLDAPLALSAGPHTMRLVNRELGVDRTISVQVEAGRSVTVREDLRR
ncbi:MAG: serine/threonine-protein kinase [Myxococcota bacterium]